MKDTRQLLITQCNDPLMWYAGMVGQTVPFLRILAEENCYLSQEPAGHSNIVKFGDAEIIKPNLPEGDMGYGKERPCKKCSEVKLIQARGLCQSCFTAEKKAGTLDNWPSAKKADHSQCDCVTLPRALTAENGAKALLIGEFHEICTMSCPECNGDDESLSDCSICHGQGYINQQVPVEWITIKAIYAKIVETLAS